MTRLISRGTTAVPPAVLELSRLAGGTSADRSVSQLTDTSTDTDHNRYGVCTGRSSAVRYCCVACRTWNVRTSSAMIVKMIRCVERWPLPKCNSRRPEGNGCNSGAKGQRSGCIERAVIAG